MEYFVLKKGKRESGCSCSISFHLESGVQQIIMWNISRNISCVEGFILTLSWTGFYVIGATVMKELGRAKNPDFFSILYFLFFN